MLILGAIGMCLALTVLVLVVGAVIGGWQRARRSRRR